MAASECNLACTHDQNNVLKFKLRTRMRKKGDLNYFERGLACLPSTTSLTISETTELLQLY